MEAPDADAAQTEAACCGRVSAASAMPLLLLAPGLTTPLFRADNVIR